MGFFCEDCDAHIEKTRNAHYKEVHHTETLLKLEHGLKFPTTNETTVTVFKTEEV